MKAMVFEKVGTPLILKEVPIPEPTDQQILIKVNACGVCRTDLHIVDDELPHPKLPLILGHQIVGIVTKLGSSVTRFKVGDRVGVPWLGETCGDCEFCLSQRENLCDRARYTGYDIDGGYAEYCVAHAEYCFFLPSNYTDLDIAPLLCAGLIGYRALKLAGKAKKIGFYGFGSSAHILTQLVKFQGNEVYAFVRNGDDEGVVFAKRLGVNWVGSSEELPPEPLDAAILFAPVGALYPQALKAIKKGATVVSAGIHMSDIPSFPYSLLWEERVMRSVANLTRLDGQEFLHIAPQIPIKAEINLFNLEQANEALKAIRSGTLSGSAVLSINKNNF